MARRIHEGFQFMRASERRYRRIFENTQDFYFEMSPARGGDGSQSSRSVAAADFPRADHRGITLRIFCDRAEFARFLAEVVQNGRVTNRELGMRDATGTRVEVLVNATLRRDGEQLSESIIGSIRDISDAAARKRRAAKRRSAFGWL